LASLLGCIQYHWAQHFFISIEKLRFSALNENMSAIEANANTRAEAEIVNTPFFPAGIFYPLMIDGNISCSFTNANQAS
jgi:hypothetical protein